MEEKQKCPFCASELTVAIANQRHCQSCGREFDIESNPISARALREKIGWPIPKA
jgi:transposase-like protein